MRCTRAIVPPPEPLRRVPSRLAWRSYRRHHARIPPMRGLSARWSAATSPNLHAGTGAPLEHVSQAEPPKSARTLVDSAGSRAEPASHMGHTQPGRGRPAGALAPMPAPRLPPARVSALLVLPFLGFGVLLGGSSHVNGTLAASAGRLNVMLPQTTAAAGRPSSPAAPASAPPGEPPESEPAGTPEPTEAATTPAGRAPTTRGPTTKAPTTKGGPPASSLGSGGGGAARHPPARRRSSRRSGTCS
ncbi:MAG: hypothetical protein JWO21_38 [Solirubrobacterales bacterium]|jgi:hypothetical protein|nr:hypothetical protein [Solirubrobacterales bacterium]